MMRELAELPSGTMVCTGCGVAPVPVEVGLAEPITYGPCNCDGWRAEQQPELVALVERYSIDKRGDTER